MSRRMTRLPITKKCLTKNRTARLLRTTKSLHPSKLPSSRPPRRHPQEKCAFLNRTCRIMRITSRRHHRQSKHPPGSPCGPCQLPKRSPQKPSPLSSHALPHPARHLPWLSGRVRWSRNSRRFHHHQPPGPGRPRSPRALRHSRKQRHPPFTPVSRLILK